MGKIHGIVTQNMDCLHTIAGSEEADLVIVIGTTGFRSDEYLSRMRPGTKLVQINPSETPLDRIATLNIRADAAEVLDTILQEAGR